MDFNPPKLINFQGEIWYSLSILKNPQTLKHSLLNIKEVEEKDTVNNDHSILPATPKGYKVPGTNALLLVKHQTNHCQGYNGY